MPVKTIFTITKGTSKTKVYEYDQKESLFIGRSKDCHIIFDPSSHSTISRHHCLVEIVPPHIKVRDFGSRNGTYLNGEIIGKRKKHQSPEEGLKNQFNEIDVKSGDRLGLGKDCEIEIKIILPPDIINDNNNNKIKCAVCKKELFRIADNSGICFVCKQNPRKILDYLIRKAEAENGGDDLNYIAGYRIIKSLGSGGMGEVWQVEEEKTGKQMALKVMLPKVSVNEKNRRMFLRESAIGEQLIHKNIVHQFKSGKSTENIYFILMELCQ